MVETKKDGSPVTTWLGAGLLTTAAVVTAYTALTVDKPEWTLFANATPLEVDALLATYVLAIWTGLPLFFWNGAGKLKA